MMLSNRAQSLKPSPTLAMANRARELQAAGVDVVSLAVGEPDWPSYPEAVEAGIQALQSGFTRYTAAHGIVELREAIAVQTTKELGLSYSAGDVAVATGAKYALFSALQILINPGDVVLIPAPYWVSYPVMAELAGARCVEIPSTVENNFKIQAEQLETAIQEAKGRAKVLMFCSPNNPTGIAYSAAELRAIAAVVKKYPELVVLSDDIYNRLIFSDSPALFGGGSGAVAGAGTPVGAGVGAGAQSAGALAGQAIRLAAHLLHVAPELRNQVIVVNSVSKSCAMTGWRVGWALGPKSFIQPLSDFLSQSTSNICSIAQKAAVRAVQVQDQKLPEVLGMLEARRKIFSEGLGKVQGLKVYAPDGAFYLWVGVQGWIGKKHARFQKTLSDSKLVSEALLEAAGLAVVPGVEFGMEGYLRLSLAASETNLRKATERMAQFSKELN